MYSMPNGEKVPEQGQEGEASVEESGEWESLDDDDDDHGRHERRRVAVVEGHVPLEVHVVENRVPRDAILMPFGPDAARRAQPCLVRHSCRQRGQQQYKRP